MGLTTQPGSTETPQHPGKARRGGLHHDISWIRRVLFGSPIETAHQEHSLLTRLIALPVFASDAISSVAYASQEILLALGAAGLWTLANRQLYTDLTLGITAAIVFLLVVVVTSYWQTVFAYPSGGGSYIVSKDNLGTTAGLIAGAALLIDYVLTVSVSIASGVQNLTATPILQRFQNDQVLLCILAIGLLTLANLRGLKESGTFFAIFTYTFVIMALVMIFLGIVGPMIGWQIHREAVNQVIPRGAYSGVSPSLMGIALVGLVLRAFANGCAAMTGTEAVSNGVPAFRKPKSLNAALTLAAMGAILACLFLGISWIATSLHVVYWKHGNDTSLPVIDQISGAIFGKTGNPIRVGLYYLMQVATGAILLLAANTSFADFPRLASLMARDRFLPRQLTNVGDKLVFSNGIALLGILAMVLVAAFGGVVDRLIPLYAVGVFTAFTLSQSGMVKHWFRLRTPGWHTKAFINGLGATCTAIVLGTILVEKGPEGAYWVVLVAALLLVLFRRVSSHYDWVRSKLSLVNWRPASSPFSNTVLVLVPSLHRGVFPALDYARSLSPDCRAINIEIDPNDTARLRREWEQYVGDDIPMVILPSLYRSLIAPLLVYLDAVRAERPNHVVTVVVPEFVSKRWWHSLLHNKNGLLLRHYLLSRPGVVVCNVRYFLDGENGDAEQAESGALMDEKGGVKL